MPCLILTIGGLKSGKPRQNLGLELRCRLLFRQTWMDAADWIVQQ